MNKAQIKAGMLVIPIGVSFLYIPLRAMEYSIPFWWLGLIYPIAVIFAGAMKILVYSK